MSVNNSLLAEFVRTGSERAFRELVEAYFTFVYSTAFRMAGEDRHLAEDICQRVFIDLAQKAVALPPDVQLGGWLHRHTCFLTTKAVRGERRRKTRERQAVELQGFNSESNQAMQHAISMLDGEINDLAVEDRSVILLRFFEQLDFNAIGATLGCSGDAARMRTTRALNKLETRLKRRGVALSVAGLGVLLTTKASAAARAGVAARVTRVSFVAACKKGTMWALIKDAFRTKLNIRLAGVAVLMWAIALVLALTQPSVLPAAQVSDVEIARVDTGSEPAPPDQPEPAPATSALVPSNAGSKSAPAPASTPVRPRVIAQTQTRAPATKPYAPPSKPAAATASVASQKPYVTAAARNVILLSAPPMRVPGPPPRGRAVFLVPTVYVHGSSSNSLHAVTNLARVPGWPVKIFVRRPTPVIRPQPTDLFNVGQVLGAVAQSFKAINDATQDEDAPREKLSYEQSLKELKDLLRDE